MFSASGIINYSEEHHDIFNGKMIFGDPAYSVSQYVVTGYKQAVLTTYQQIFNREMSVVRIAVEWNFGIMKRLWSFVDYKKKLRLRLSPIGKFVRVAMFLTNCHCYYNGGNQISRYSDLEPPSLEEYLLD
ncbi:hypothetical protein BBJ28_00010397 [Nothophytophthora sp. Chile5]|nr:hypothetical protein BBJ28_00010397 [Nothophytophthora sp. Chile5]